MARRSALLVILLVAFLCLMLPESPTGTGSGPAFVEGEVLLKFLPGATAPERVRLQAELGGQTLHAFRSGAEHWRLGPGVSVQQALARLSASPLIAYAEPNYLFSADVIPDDPRTVVDRVRRSPGGCGARDPVTLPQPSALPNASIPLRRGAAPRTTLPQADERLRLRPWGAESQGPRADLGRLPAAATG